MTEKKKEITKALKPVHESSIKELVLVHPKKQFIASGGTEEQLVREAGFALQMINNNTYLGTLDKQSIVDSIVNVALTGLTLNPELRLGYLVPYGKKVFFRSSYMGKREIILKSGLVKELYVELVYENDHFEVTQGADKKLIHKPNYLSSRGELRGGYWYAKQINGVISFGVMTKERIDEIKERFSESYKRAKDKKGGKSPWVDDYEEMAKKTILNWGFKDLPKSGLSENIIKALEVDGELDRKIYRDIDDPEKTEDKDFFNEDRNKGETIEDAQVVEEEAKEEKPSEDNKPIEEGVVPPSIIEEAKKLINKSKLPEDQKRGVLDGLTKLNYDQVMETIEYFKELEKEK